MKGRLAWVECLKSSGVGFKVCSRPLGASYIATKQLAPLQGNLIQPITPDLLGYLEAQLANWRSRIWNHYLTWVIK